MVKKRIHYVEKFLLALHGGFMKAIPIKGSRNSIRIQFLIKLAILFVYAHYRGIHLIITDLYRSAEAQFQRYQQGRTTPGKIVTNTDGYKKRSMHQFWRAADLLIMRFSEGEFRSIWSDRETYKELGEFWEKLEGRWGGRWFEEGKTKFDDVYHFEF
jgi:peptidoglycan L-alanyl-D-glutamate endopeptidase CwlK